MAALAGASSPASPGVFDRPVLVIAIAGGTGSGKSTLANAIRQAIGDEHIAHISHDSFYKDLTHLEEADRALTNFDHPNSLDTDLFVQSLKDLRNGRAVEIPMYDFSTHARLKESQTLAPRPVILCEGILIFSEPALRGLFDIKIYVDAPADIRFIRRLMRDKRERGRDSHSVIQQYLSTVRPMHEQFVEPSKRYADIIVPEGGKNAVARDMVLSRIMRDLTSRGAIVDGAWTPSLRANSAEPDVSKLTL